MLSNNPRFVGVLALVVLLAVGGLTGPAVAQEEDCLDGCVEAPDNKPDFAPGMGGMGFDAPVVDTGDVMPGDRVTFDGDFATFLKAKKAFGADNGIIAGA